MYMQSPECKMATATSSEAGIDGEGSGPVMVYIDNSNVFINAQHHSAKVSKFPSGIQDNCRRIDSGKLVALAVNKREVLCAKLYGSEPPALDTVWRNIRKKLITVRTSERSRWNKREKETDTKLVADAVEDMMLHIPISNKTIIIFSGDKDMLEIVRKGLKYNCNIEIWSFDSCLHRDIKQESKKNPKRIEINYIEDHFAKVSFRETRWKKSFIPPERSIVILLDELVYNKVRNCKNEEERQEQIKGMIRNIAGLATSVFRLPIMGRFLDESCKPITEFFEKSGQSYAHANPFESRFNSGNQMQNKKVIPLTLVCCYKESANNFATGDPKLPYTFDSHIWKKRDELRFKVEGCVHVLTYIQYQQHVGLEKQEEDDDLDELDPDLLDVDFTLVERKQWKKPQQYSEPCKYRFCCKHGTKCQYGHSEDEYAYFKETPKSTHRYLYKSKPCNRTFIGDVSSGGCRYREIPHLCSYAHSMQEVRCTYCGETGQHWMDDCPERNLNLE